MLEKNKIYNMDCIKGMKLLEDKSIDCIICDLPYGTTWAKWDKIIDFNELWEQYNRIIKDNGAIVLFGSEPFSSALRMSNIKNYKYDWVWEKSKATGFLNAKKRPLVAHEYIHVFYKKQPLYNPQMREGTPYNKGMRKQQTENDVYGEFKQVEVKSEGKRYPRSVIYYKTAETEGETFHKTQKPASLLEYLINTYTNTGEVVLDNCMGSGSTGIACLNTNRKFIGIELDDTYFNVAKERINNALNK